MISRRAVALHYDRRLSGRQVRVLDAAYPDGWTHGDQRGIAWDVGKKNKQRFSALGLV
jgi:hypothetical protein